MRAKRQLLSTQTISGDLLALAGAVGAVTLAILALAGTAPRTTASIAAICLGTGLIGHGAIVTHRLMSLPRPVGAPHAEATLGEAAPEELLGGTAAITLGILALIGFAPLLLLGVAAIAAGGALMFAGPTKQKVLHLEPDRVHVERRAGLAKTASGDKRTLRMARRRKRSRAAQAKRRSAARAHRKAARERETVSAVADHSEAHAHKARSKQPKASNRRRAKHDADGEHLAQPKSLPELIAELPPPPVDAPAPQGLRGAPLLDSRETFTSLPEDPPPRADADPDVEPLFEPGVLASARSNPDVVDVRAVAVVEQVADARQPDLDVAIPAPRLVVDSHEQAMSATASELDADARTPDGELAELTPEPVPAQPPAPTSKPRGLAKAFRAALLKAKTLKHKLDAHLEAHPIEQPPRVEAVTTKALVPIEEHATALVATHESETALVATRETANNDRIADKLAIDKRVEEHEREVVAALESRATAAEIKHALEIEPEHVHATTVSTEAQDEEPHILDANGRATTPEHATRSKELGHEREALVRAQELAHALASRVEPRDEAASRREAERLAHTHVRETELEVIAGEEPLADAALTVAEARERAYEHEAHAKAVVLEHDLAEHLESHDLEHADATVTAPDVPVFGEKLHRHAGLYLGAVSWTVGGLAAVVLGVLAVVGVAHAWVLVESGLVAAGAAMLVSSVARGAGLVHRRSASDSRRASSARSSGASHGNAKRARSASLASVKRTS